jgi:CHAD domain-containing protein
MLGRALEDRWRTFASRAAKVNRRPTEKAVHDLRVSMRRLVALLDVAAETLTVPALPRLRKEVKRHLGALGALRDTQVQILMTRELLPSFPALQLFLSVLLVREKRLLKSARREITAPRLLSMDSLREKIGEGLEALPDDPVFDQALHRIFSGILARAFARSLSLLGPALRGDIEAIHRLRLSFKRLRYAAETLLPMQPGITQDLLRAMGRYQARMGALQDLQVFAGSVTHYTRRNHRLAPEEFALLQAKLVGERKERVEAFASSAHELTHFWRALHHEGGHS